MGIQKFNLKEARMYRDKTLQEVADILGVHPHTYAKLEKNSGKTTFIQAKKLSEFLDLDINQIIFFN